MTSGRMPRHGNHRLRMGGAWITCDDMRCTGFRQAVLTLSHPGKDWTISDLQMALANHISSNRQQATPIEENWDK